MPDSQYNSVNELRRHDLLDWLALIVPGFTQFQPITTDAGMRRYFRLCNDKYTMIAVDADPTFEDNSAFIDIAERLRRSGLKVPEIYHYNLEKGFLLVEDLGDQHLQNRLEKNNANSGDLYQSAFHSMVKMQQFTSTDKLPEFDRTFILFELNIFEEWFVERHLHYKLDRQSRRIIGTFNQLLAENCEQQPQAFMHRDFHSRNLMVNNQSELAIIDFQGAMLGPVTYDTGSLLKDAYIQPPRVTEKLLCEQHRQSLTKSISAEQYDYWYRLTALQRHLKIMGLFCRLKYRDGKSGYVQHLDTVAGFIFDTLSRYSELHDFRDLFSNLLDYQHNSVVNSGSAT